MYYCTITITYLETRALLVSLSLLRLSAPSLLLPSSLLLIVTMVMVKEKADLITTRKVSHAIARLNDEATHPQMPCEALHSPHPLESATRRMLNPEMRW